MKDTFFQCIFVHAGIILLCESIYPFETVVDVNVLLTNALYSLQTSHRIFSNTGDTKSSA